MMDKEPTRDDFVALFLRCADTLRARGYSKLAATWEANALKIENEKPKIKKVA